jgi:hypothetical protein
VSGYDALDDRIQKTRHHKDELLIVLLHPEISLHNNAAELAARRTLSATAAKLGVNFYHYLTDRLKGAREIPSLAALIPERAAQLNLGASWEAS